MSSRVIVYYQTFTGLGPILHTDPDVTHIHLSSLHFGVEADGQPYIHLNDLYPDHPQFDQVWADLDQAVALGIKVLVMIGGAGGGFQALFDNYEVGYQQLKTLLERHQCISGVDLDIEEPVSLDNVKRLIADIMTDFPNYILAMAPLQGSLEQDIPGMGGFVYKDLYLSPEGAFIDYFNGQFYTDFSVQAFDQVVANGYPPNKVVMGSLSGTGSYDVVQTLANKYQGQGPGQGQSGYGGVFSWEYSITPESWPLSMRTALVPSPI